MPINSKHPEFDVTKSTLTNDAFSGNVLDCIPRLTGQTDQEYKDYRERAAFFNVVKRTCKALVGAITRKPYTTNIDTDDINISGGLNFDEFINNILEQIKIGGRIGLLADFDDSRGEPTIISYTNKRIVNWREDNDKLILVVLEEPYYKPKDNDPYEVEIVNRYRELLLLEDVYTVRVWEQSTNKSWRVTEEYIPSHRGKTFDHIPFVCINTTDTTNEPKEPTLYTLAAINIAHFKNSTDLEHAAHYTALPQPYIAGGVDGDASELPIGTFSVWQLTEGSTADYLEFSGKGIGTLQEMMRHKEEQMSAIGSRLLQEKKGVEATETLRIKQGGETATLVNLVGAVESGLQTILTHYQMWNGKETEIEFEMNKDFTPTRLSPQEIKSLMDAVVAGTISQETFLQNLYDGEIVDDVELEKGRLNTTLSTNVDNV